MGSGTLSILPNLHKPIQCVFHRDIQLGCEDLTGECTEAESFEAEAEPEAGLKEVNYCMEIGEAQH